MTSLYDMTPEDAERALHRARMEWVPLMEPYPERQAYRSDMHRTFFLHKEFLGPTATIAVEVTIYDRTEYVVDEAWLVDVAGVECSQDDNKARLDPQKVERECAEELMRLVAEAWQS